MFGRTVDWDDWRDGVSLKTPPVESLALIKVGSRTLEMESAGSHGVVPCDSYQLRNRNPKMEKQIFFAEFSINERNRL